MKNRLVSIAVVCWMITTQLSYSQIQFKLTHKADTKTFVVSIIPQKTYQYPNNIISTAQVTLKVQTNQDFMLSNFKAAHGEEKWMKNSTVKSPELSPKFDFYSFGLQTMGSANYPLVKGEEVELFSFENLGNDNPEVSLIDNEDIMVKSMRKTRVNLGNQISVLGENEGLSNAYSGNYKVDATEEAKLNSKFTIQNIFPNPASEKMAVEWTNTLEENPEELSLVLIDSNTGITIKSEPILNANLGKNKVGLTVSDVSSGRFLLKIQNKVSSSKATHVTIVH